MRVAESLAPALVCVACTTTPAGQPPTPLVPVDEPACPPSTLPFGDDCVETPPILLKGSQDQEAWFAPRQVDGRTYWYSPGPIDEFRTREFCEVLGGVPLTPRTRRDIGVGQHFATLSAETARGEPGVWTGWSLDLASGTLVDPDGAVWMRWQAGRPPMRGFLDNPVEAELQEDIDRVGQGLESLRGVWRTTLAADGTLNPKADSTVCCGAVCEAP